VTVPCFQECLWREHISELQDSITLNGSPLFILPISPETNSCNNTQPASSPLNWATLFTRCPILQATAGLKDRLEAVLFQFPPFFKCDNERLASFLAALPPDIPAAFEFRHESWFTEEMYGILQGKGAALCVHDADDKTTPVRLTSRFAYLRLRKSRYSPESRAEWQETFRGWIAQGVDVFAFIKHQDNPEAPLVALEFGGAPVGQ
jgi:uncharacterized protein YecE (DUF72 family)